MKIKTHKATQIIYAILITISLLIYVLLIYFCSIGINNIVLKQHVFDLLKEEEWAIEVIKYFGGFAAIVIVIVIIISVLLSLYKYGITALAYDVPITEHQFKELLDFEIECVKKLGLKEVPKMYIDTYSYGQDEEIRVNGAKFENKHILRIDAQDIFNSVEEGYYVAKFTIARKLVFLYLGYYDLPAALLTLCSRWVPFINNLGHRIICYNCDKGAVALMGEGDVIKAITTQATGYYLTPYVNREDYIDNMKNVVEHKDVIIENILLDTPITAYRIEAILKDIDGRLF